MTDSSFSPIRMPGQLATTDTTWKPADIGFFDPSKKFQDGMDIVNNVSYYSDVYTFIDRMTDLVLLKSEEVVRANIHSCLKGDALSWYSQELTSDERLMNQVPLEDGWFRMMTKRFKPDRTEALQQIDKHTYEWAVAQRTQ